MRSSRRRSKKSAPRESAVPENRAGMDITDMNFEGYVGQTVTVYVNAGGAAGKGFTGVLMSRTDTYIRLLVMPALPPACSLGNPCGRGADNILFCALCQYNANSSMGAMAVIPMRNVVAFVHSTVHSGR